MKPIKLSKARQLSISVLAVAVVFGLWAFFTYPGLIRPFFLPSPTTVGRSIIKLFSEFDLLTDIAVSVFRIVLGFSLACIISVPLGILTGLSKKAAAFFDPIVGFVRYIPPSAFVPLFILWFGIGNLEKVLIIFAGVVSFLTILIFDVVSNIKKEFTEAALTLGAKPKEVVFKVIIPQALPGIWDAMRAMIGAAWTYLVVAEMVASTSGLGHLIITSQRFLQTPNVIAAILVIGAIGLLTNYLFKAGHRILFPWTGKSEHA